jgi:hypothetical protein
MRPQKITFGEMRDMGVRGVLIYCADYPCSHSVGLSADRWPDDLRLSDIFVCAACGRRGAQVRPDFNCNRSTVPAMGYSPKQYQRQQHNRHYTCGGDCGLAKESLDPITHRTAPCSPRWIPAGAILALHKCCVTVL